MTPREAYITALNEHRNSLETLTLREAGFKLSLWTSDTAWEIGDSDTTCWLIASEFGTHGNHYDTGDYDCPTWQRLALSLSRCWAMRVDYNPTTGDMEETMILRDGTLAAAMEAVSVGRNLLNV